MPVQDSRWTSRLRSPEQDHEAMFSGPAVLSFSDDRAPCRVSTGPVGWRMGMIYGRRLLPWGCLWGYRLCVASNVRMLRLPRSSNQQAAPPPPRWPRKPSMWPPPTWPSIASACPGLRAGGRSEGQTPASAYIRRSGRRRLMILNWRRRACFPTSQTS
jgi:hypothetical protein